MRYLRGWKNSIKQGRRWHRRQIDSPWHFCQPPGWGNRPRLEDLLILAHNQLALARQPLLRRRSLRHSEQQGITARSRTRRRLMGDAATEFFLTPAAIGGYGSAPSSGVTQEVL